MAGLGRGLGSLIPQKVNKITTSSRGEAVVNVSSLEDLKRLLEVNPHEIQINPYQPRRRFKEEQLQELMDSIRQHGLIQPLVVTRREDGVYELIAGERRLRASQNLGLKTVPVVVRDADSQQKLEMALVENIQREDLNAIEMALAYRKLLDEFNISQDVLAQRVGKARPTVTNTLRMLNLPNHIQEALIDGLISEGHAKIIVGLDTEDKQTKLFQQILDNKMSVGAAHKETRRMGGTKEARVKMNYQDKDKEYILRDFFKTKVEIMRNSKGGGKIVLDFYSDEDLDNFIKKLNGATI
ncbi:MAG: ParB/RepB/Spo0J family partition protein [Candidatus Falkowbacteria bacterium]|nr:ParB/RepB/Spo0J family partition protein [Candidatus Falkowbacteria bacterium]